MTYRWETPDAVWLEDENGHFMPAASPGLGQFDWTAHGRARSADLAQLLGAAVPAACAHSAMYPPEFQWCPQCGQPLVSAGVQETWRDWFGPSSDPDLPRGVPHGLPVTGLRLGAALEQRVRNAAPRPDRTMPAPPNAVCVFAAAHFGYPVQRLIALAYTRGVLQYWDPARKLWQVFQPEDPADDIRFTQSAYGWLPNWNPQRGEVGIVPTARGLRRLWLNPVNETWHAQPLMQLPVCSAPGAVRRYLACIVKDGQALWTGTADLSHQQEYPLDVPGSGWSRPFAYDGRLAWLHAEGHLAWRPDAAPEFLRWPEGWTPRLDFGGPTQSRDGRLWLAGHDGSGYSFVELLAAAPEQRPIDGARLGFASLLFRRGHEIKGDPWDVEDVEDPHADDALVLPLLRAYDGQQVLAHGLVLRLHQYTGRAEDALASRTIARSTVEWIGQTNVVLDEVARLSRPVDCVPFVYDGALWLHHPDWHTMRGWDNGAAT